MRHPLAARAARFLGPDGRTRTEVYWGALPGALPFPRTGAAQLVQMTARQMTADYRPQASYAQQHRLPPGLSAADVVLPARVLDAEGDTALYHLGVQWDQYLLAGGDGGAQRLGSATVQFDSLRALRRDAGALEMSDLVPLLATEEEVAAAAPGERPGRPYPFAVLSPGTPLALYVEAYHLTYAEDDRTRYTVEYDVLRRAEQGGSSASSLGGGPSVAPPRLPRSPARAARRANTSYWT